jgi:catechol 2,3-dioxygenase-like lactoylglutathione lyase family enzyme
MRVHISLPVTNLETSIGFYAALFGQDASKRRPDYANFRLEQPAIHLALNERPGAARAEETEDTDDPVNHFGIEVGDVAELARVRARLVAAALAHRDEHNATCCYDTGEKVWTRDPDGHTWEIWVRTGEAAVMHAPESECCVPTADASEAAAKAKTGVAPSCCG